MSSSYVSGQRMKIAVTGCSGSVARAIVIYAINQGHDVLGIDVADRPPIEDPSFCFIKTDLTDYAAVVEALRTCHALYVRLKFCCSVDLMLLSEYTQPLFQVQARSKMR